MTGISCPMRQRRVGSRGAQSEVRYWSCGPAIGAYFGWDLGPPHQHHGRLLALSPTNPKPTGAQESVRSACTCMGLRVKKSHLAHGVVSGRDL
jgi:hypothetical protein